MQGRGKVMQFVVRLIMVTSCFAAVVFGLNQHGQSVHAEADPPSPPQLVADAMKLPSSAIEISFADDAAWRSAVTSVRSGGIPLSPDQYAWSPGKLTLLPNALSPGVHQIEIHAEGYAVTSAEQLVQPNMPDGVQVQQAGHNFVTLGWDAATGAQSYRVYYKTAGGAEQSMDVADISVTITELTDDVQYAFQVAALADGLESSRSGEIFATPVQEIGTGDVWERLPVFPGLHPVMDWDGQQLFVAYRQGGGASARIWDGSSWEQLGPDKISVHNGLHPAIATDEHGSGEKTVYVGYADQQMGHKLTVQTYDALNDKWDVVGSAGFSAYSSTRALSIGVFQGTPYAASVSVDVPDEIHVMGYNRAEDEWAIVGGGPIVAEGSVNVMKFMIHGSTAYLGYVEYLSSSYRLKMLTMELDAPDPQWQPIDMSGSPIQNQWHFSTDFFTVKDDTLFIAYYGFGSKIELKSWTSDAGWTDIGGPPVAYSPYNVGMDTDGDAVYVIARAGQEASSEMTIWKRLNGIWFEVGQGIMPEGGIAHYASVKSVDNRPYVSFYNGSYMVEVHRMAYTWCEAVLQYNNGQPDETLIVPCGEPIPDPGSLTRDGYLFTEWRINNERHVFQNPIYRDVVVAAGWRLPTPEHLAAGYEDGKIHLTWDAVEHAAAYKVYISTSAGAHNVEPVIVSGTSHTFEALTNGQTYFLTVQATDGTVDSLPATEISERPRTVPGAPAISQVYEYDASVRVSFSAPETDGGALIQKYVVNWKHADGTGHETTGSVEGTGTPITVGGLTNRLAYTFTVTAFNSEGESLPSAPAEAMPHKACVVMMYAWDDALNRAEFIPCGDSIAEPQPESRPHYTFEGWFDAAGQRFDFSAPIAEDTYIYGRWSFDPAQLPPETWHIIDADPDASFWKHAMEDDMLYVAKKKNGNMLVRKYEAHTGWTQAAPPLGDASPYSPIVDMAVRDGRVYLLHYNADNDAVVSSYDADTGAWTTSMPIEAGDYPQPIQLLATSDAIYVSVISGAIDKSAYIWRNTLNIGHAWDNIAPVVPGVQSLTLHALPGRLVALLGTLNASYAEDLHLLQWDQTASSEPDWTELADLSAHPSKLWYSSSRVLPYTDDALLLAYRNESYEHELLYVKDGQASARDVPLSAAPEFDISGMNGDPYHVSFAADEISVFVYKDGSWTVRDRIPTLEDSNIFRIDAGGGSNTQYISYRNNTGELIIRFYTLPYYTVTFDPQGGSEVDAVMGRYDTLIAETAAPTREGYAFVGWYKDAEGTQPWDFATDRIPARNMTLYAIWSPNSPSLGAPTIQSAEAGDSSVALAWTSVSSAVGYHIYQSEREGQYSVPSTTVTDTVYQVTGLTNGTAYYFVVTAILSGGESEFSNEVSAVPQAASPGAPVLYSPVAGNAQVRLAWSGVPDATGYIIHQRAAGSATVTEAATVTAAVYQYDVTGLTNGVMYYFTVSATNPAGVGPVSNTVSAMPVTVPSAPANVQAAAGNGTATVSFNIPADDGGSPITGYEVSDLQGNLVAEGSFSPIAISGLRNGQRYSFIVRAINDAGRSDASPASNEVIPRAPSSDDGNNDEDETGSPSPNNSPSDQQPESDNREAFDVLVNGQPVNAGTAATTKVNERQVTAIAVDPEKMGQRLAEEAPGAVISIPALLPSDVIIGTLNGQMVKSMEQQEAVIELVTEHASYTIPAQQIRIDAVAEKLGGHAALQDIEIRIEISSPAGEQLQWIEQAAFDQAFTIVAPPLHFTVTGVHEDTSIEISAFSAYIERTIALPDDADPGQITTAVVIAPDGSVRHVPTKVEIVNGRYSAIINSLTNSMYALIWNPLQYEDTADHWARDAIHNMGARKIVNGTGDHMYQPDRDITRAEFAAIIVQALGLKMEDGTAPFSDVQQSDWYSGAVQTAYAYNLISGFEDGMFRPMDKIAREQAMVIIARAMEITKIMNNDGAKYEEHSLAAFADANQVSSWARSGVIHALQAGIVSGRGHLRLAPKANITRAEAALIVQQLLQQSDLI